MPLCFWLCIGTCVVVALSVVIVSSLCLGMNVTLSCGGPPPSYPQSVPFRPGSILSILVEQLFKELVRLWTLTLSVADLAFSDSNPRVLSVTVCSYPAAN